MIDMMRLNQHSTLVSDMYLLGDEMNILPNPATEFIIIRTSDTPVAKFIFIYDMNGTLVYKETFYSCVIKIDVKSLSPGLYTAVLRNDELRSHGRFLKQ